MYGVLGVNGAQNAAAERFLFFFLVSLWWQQQARVKRIAVDVGAVGLRVARFNGRCPGQEKANEVLNTPSISAAPRARNSSEYEKKSFQREVGDCGNLVFLRRNHGSDLTMFRRR